MPTKTYYNKLYVHEMAMKFIENHEKHGIKKAVIRLNGHLATKERYDVAPFIKKLEKANISITPNIAEVLINHNPQAITVIPNPSKKLYIKAILNTPAIISIIPQDSFLCKLAMNKDITTYPLIKEKFKTYEHCLIYGEREKELKKVLGKIKEARQPKIETLSELPAFGIEMEFMTNKPIFEVYLLLKKYINISIGSEKNEGSGWMLTKEDTRRDTLPVFEVSSKRLQPGNTLDIKGLYQVCMLLEILQKFSHITTNPECCGLHVHINQENCEEVAKHTNNYMYLQPALDKLFANKRRYNHFCMPVTNAVLDDLKNLSEKTYIKFKDKFYSINPYSYFYHGTVEFRQHEAIFEFVNIMHWLSIIQSIITLPKRKNNYILFLDDLYNILNVSKETQEYYTNKYVKGR